MPAPRSRFGARLEQELVRISATQQQLALQLGVSQQTVSKWMTGETTPRLRHVPRMEELLALAPGTLTNLLFEPLRQPPPANDDRPPTTLTTVQRKLEGLTGAELDAVDLYIDEVFQNRG